MRIAITGGHGFVGGHLTAQWRALGHEVTPLARGAAPGEPFDLLIHAGWNLHEPEANRAASRRIFEGARASGVRRILFMSSLSAFPGCRSRYGAAKLAVEEIGAELGVCSVRLGFVCDRSGRGLSGSLRRLAALPAIPVPDGGRQKLFTIQAEDVGPALLKIAHIGPAGPVNLAHPDAVTLASLLRAFARENGKRPLLVPVPWRMLHAPLRAAEAAGIRLAFRSDSLVSLMNQNPAPDFRTLGEWGIAPRPFPAPPGPE
jgi:nucleoside-diphosphate-sugar epimerase